LHHCTDTSFCLAATSGTEVDLLSLHDALPIWNLFRLYNIAMEETIELGHVKIDKKSYEVTIDGKAYLLPLKEFELLFLLASHKRSEEHTSELQSRFDLVCRLLLEKKKTRPTLE